MRSKHTPAYTLDLNSQWTADENGETCWIMGIEDHWPEVDGRIIIYILTDSNVRKSMTLATLLENYSYVPPMKGAYK